MLKKCALIAALLLAVGPASARADWLFIPNIGVGFGGQLPENDKLTYGASISYMGEGIVGFEADLSWTPKFLESNNDDNFDFEGSDNASAVMANVIVGIPFGGTQGLGIRPYVATGFGLMRAEISSDEDLFNLSRNDWGWDIGVGAMGFMSEHVGLRGDVRYYKDLQNNDFVDDNFDPGVNNNFNYWRGTAGLAFRW